MSIVNSYSEKNKDDSDITIIHPSIVDINEQENPGYVPLITRLRQANSSAAANHSTVLQTNGHASDNDQDDFIFVDHYKFENAKHIEEFLKCYLQELSYETNTVCSCSHRLIVRLVDLIRPVYSYDEKKLNEYDKLVEEIAALHDKRDIEQKETIQSLDIEISRLKKIIYEKEIENSSSDIYNKNSSIPMPCNQVSLINHEQWTEIADDTKKLQEIVETQRTQINELISLLSDATAKLAEFPNYTGDSSNSTHTSSPNIEPNPANSSLIATLLKRIETLTVKPPTDNPTTSAPKTELTLSNHSPGVSPTQSLSTLTLESLQPPTNGEIQPKPEVNNTPIVNLQPTVLPQPSIPIESRYERSIIRKQCPACNEEFPSNIDNAEFYDHVERCLFQPHVSQQINEYECPNCTKKYPMVEEHAYLQHVTDCYNNEP